jgi:hypothetical protein
MFAAVPKMDKGIEEEEYSIESNKMNYHALVLTGTSAREELEDKARKVQNRTGRGCE